MLPWLPAGCVHVGSGDGLVAVALVDLVVDLLEAVHSRCRQVLNYTQTERLGTVRKQQTVSYFAF